MEKYPSHATPQEKAAQFQYINNQLTQKFQPYYNRQIALYKTDIEQEQFLINSTLFTTLCSLNHLRKTFKYGPNEPQGPLDLKQSYMLFDKRGGCLAFLKHNDCPTSSTITGLLLGKDPSYNTLEHNHLFLAHCGTN